MAALPYMQFYIADYLADTAHLATIEHGAYLLLIMTYWQRGKPLPNDDLKLARIARMSVDDWREIAPQIREFFTEADGFLIHGRIDRDLEKVAEKSDKAKRAVASREDRKGNERSTNVERTMNDSFTSLDTDTDTDTDKEREEGADSAESPPRSPDHPQEDTRKDYNGIRMTPEAFSRLCARWSQKLVLDYCEKVRDYCKSHGKRYKDYEAAVRNFIKGDHIAEMVPARARASPPAKCPRCGQPTVGTEDRYGHPKCGLFWNYDRDKDEWIPEAFEDDLPFTAEG